MRRLIATGILLGLLSGCQETSIPLSDEPAYVPTMPTRYDSVTPTPQSWASA